AGLLLTEWCHVPQIPRLRQGRQNKDPWHGNAHQEAKGIFHTAFVPSVFRTSLQADGTNPQWFSENRFVQTRSTPSSRSAILTTLPFASRTKIRRPGRPFLKKASGVSGSNSSLFLPVRWPNSLPPSSETV